MKDEYLIWSRVVDNLEKSIREDEIQIIINKEFLERAKLRLKSLPKPKIAINKPVGTG